MGVMRWIASIGMEYKTAEQASPVSPQPSFRCHVGGWNRSIFSLQDFRNVYDKYLKSNLAVTWCVCD